MNGGYPFDGPEEPTTSRAWAGLRPEGFLMKKSRIEVSIRLDVSERLLRLLLIIVFLF